MFKSVVLLFLFVNTMYLWAADIRATAVNGKPVILHDNGRWNYVGIGDSQSCASFAKNAVAQQRLNQKRGCGFAGNAWHLNYNKHYNWCLNTTPTIRYNHTKSRQDALTRCGRTVVNKPTYLGCFIDKPQRDLKSSVSTGTKPMTNQACINVCKAKGFRYAGTQFSYQCFCDNSYGRYGKAPASECNKPCKGNLNAKCGGTWRNSVYRTGK